MQFPMQNVAIFVPNLVPKFNYSLYSFEMEFHLENGSKRIIRISNSLNFNSESTAIWAASWQKPTKWQVCPAKTQISLGTRPVWSEASLSAWWNLGSLATHWAHSEVSDQTGRTVILFVLSWGGSFMFCKFYATSDFCTI